MGLAEVLTTSSMPFKKQQFSLPFTDLEKVIDVDDSAGRSVPINMNFVQEGYLGKDTGIELFGAVEASLCHSLFYYKKKDGTGYSLRAKSTKLQSYNHNRIATADSATDTLTSTAHGYADTTQIYLRTTGTMPTGLTAGTIYFVKTSAANTFQLSLTSGGAIVDFTTNGTGTLYFYKVTPVWEDLSPTYTANAEFAFNVYNDILWLSNGVEDYGKWDGTTFTNYATAPKGNILEVFEDRMFVSGVTAEPLTAYYSSVSDPSTFGATDLVKPLGTDSVTNLKNYYGNLLIFKQFTIWKLTFEYNQVIANFVPKLAIQSRLYGACGRKAVTSVENDLWFFTGTEVRSIGYQDTVYGVFGINKDVLSESIKDTLKLISSANYSKCGTYYYNRRFYLAIPLSSSLPDTVFVAHTLYRNAWTKYTSRDKAKMNDFMVVDGVIYTNVSSGNYGTIKWTSSLNDISTAISCSVTFKRIEDSDFNRYRTYRYLGLDFKSLQAVMTVTITQEANDTSTYKTKDFFIGVTTEDESTPIAEVNVGNELVGDGYGDPSSASPFIKRKVSFLSKNQAILIALSNARAGETFIITRFTLSGFQMPVKTYSPANIISIT